jgi:hypothetical protein
MATRKEIAHLKENWLGDPCWDIEKTEGFEEHVEELKAFRLYYEKQWKEQNQKKLETKADLLGFPGNIVFARYIEKLEDKIRNMEEILESIRYKDGKSY